MPFALKLISTGQLQGRTGASGFWVGLGFGFAKGVGFGFSFFRLGLRGTACKRLEFGVLIPKGPCTQRVYTLAPMYLCRDYFKYILLGYMDP